MVSGFCMVLENKIGGCPKGSPGLSEPDEIAEKDKEEEDYAEDGSDEETGFDGGPAVHPHLFRGQV